GFASGIDLNRTGRVEVSNELAFTVSAESAHREPKFDLSPDQRWRGGVLDSYADGKWTDGFIGVGRTTRLARGDEDPIAAAPPVPILDLGPEQYFLRFTVNPRKAGGLFLSDPVVYRPGAAALPVVWDGEGDAYPIFQEQLRGAGGLVPLQVRGTIRYRQATVSLEEPDLGIALPVEAGYINHLVEPPPPQIQTFAAALLQRLVG